MHVKIKDSQGFKQFRVSGVDGMGVGFRVHGLEFRSCLVLRRLDI